MFAATKPPPVCVSWQDPRTLRQLSLAICRSTTKRVRCENFVLEFPLSSGDITLNILVLMVKMLKFKPIPIRIEQNIAKFCFAKNKNKTKTKTKRNPNNKKKKKKKRKRKTNKPKKPPKNKPQNKAKHQQKTNPQNPKTPTPKQTNKPTNKPTKTKINKQITKLMSCWRQTEKS